MGSKLRLVEHGRRVLATILPFQAKDRLGDIGIFIRLTDKTAKPPKLNTLERGALG